MYHKVRIYALSIISLCTVLAIILSGFSIMGCNTGLESSASGATTSILVWDAPTTCTDGSALLELKEYRIYFSTSPDPYSAGSYLPVSASTTSVKVKDIISQGSGIYYFVVTAVDSADRESAPSNEVIRYPN